MNSLNLKAYAKINLALDIIKKRPDGYHEIDSIEQQVKLYDTISLRKIKENKIKVIINAKIPEKENIAYKAAQLFKNHFRIKNGIQIRIKKRIPIAAGLGGGSSDAAIVLLGLNKIFSINAKKEELITMGAILGADIPFAIIGGTCRVKGKGEIVRQINNKQKLHFVLIYPEIKILTAEAYQNLEYKNIGRKKSSKAMQEGFEKKSFEKIAESLHNDFEFSLIKKHPLLEKIKKDLIIAGADNSCISGSGSTIFGIAKTGRKAKKIYNNLKMKYNKVFLTSTIKQKKG